MIHFVKTNSESCGAKKSEELLNFIELPQLLDIQISWFAII